MKTKEVHTFYNFQFKHTAVRITNHSDIQASHVAEALEIHRSCSIAGGRKCEKGRLKITIKKLDPLMS